MPYGLQFGGPSASIINRSQATRFLAEFGQEFTTGLEVEPGRTLALLGGNLSI